MKKVLFLILALSGLVLADQTQAAKRRPPRGSRPKTTARRAYRPSQRVNSQVRFRADRRGLLVDFSGFHNKITSVTYSLTYQSQGIAQGARGTVMAETAGETRTLLFGTCSAGVCRWHPNITDARLIIDTHLNSGLIIRKPYRIKI